MLTDARGVIRPQGTGCDTGAAEFIGGGVAGLPPAFFIGFDQPGIPVDAAVERLVGLGFEVRPIDPTEPVGLAEILTSGKLGEQLAKSMGFKSVEAARGVVVPIVMAGNRALTSNNANY